MIDLGQARFRLMQLVNDALSTQFKALLETKHLYQSVRVEVTEIYNPIFRNVYDAEKSRFEGFLDGLGSEQLTLSEQQAFVTSQGITLYPQLTLRVQNVKLHCSKCGQRETFSPTWHVDATANVEGLSKADHRVRRYPPQLQIFALSYQCETCKQAPVAFLIKRQGCWKLTIEGRSPIEEVEVPPFMPKPERELISDAIVAAQTGKTLAGISYLRVFIEQFGRRQTGIKGRETGEVILDGYQKLLPEDKRDHMPSLKSWYEKLSDAIHTAAPDAELFDEAYSAIVEHFDFRRIYKIPEAPAPAPQAAEKKGGG